MGWLNKINTDLSAWISHAMRIYNEVMAAKDHSIFANYQITKDCGRDEDFNQIFVLFQKVAILCIESGEIKNKFFTNNYNITPADFYQFTYFLNTIILNHKAEYLNIIKYSYAIISSVSELTIVENPFVPSEDISKEDELQEDEIFGIISGLSLDIAVRVIGHLGIDRELKQELKKYIITEDLKGFVEFSVRNNIDFSPIESICFSLLLKNIYTVLENQFEFLTLEKKFKDISTELNCNNNHFINYIGELQPEIAREINAFKLGEDGLENYFDGQPQNYILDRTWKSIYISTMIASMMKALCPHNEIVVNWNKTVQSDSLLTAIERDYTIKDLDKIPAFVIQPLEEFKARFISEQKLPPSNATPKGEKAYFSGNKIWDEGVMLILYKLLAENGLISWDTSACFSFLYRMTFQYRPSIESTDRLLRPIFWCGEKRELLSVVYYFHDGDTRIWNKLSKFFCDQNGEPIKLPAGAKNSAILTTERIDKILRYKDFRK